MTGIGRSLLSTVAYSTSWAARLTDQSGAALFPAARRWLREHQHADGSWGGRVEFPHDRLVSTLAALVALHDIAEPWTVPVLDAGAAYVWRHSTDWRSPDDETVGFELVVPRLLDEARERGLALPYQDFAPIMEIRDQKLALFPRDALTDAPTTLLYSLEALGPDIPFQRLVRFTEANGSSSNNPTATAALWQSTRSPSALAYLRRVGDAQADGGFPEIYPIDVFEPAWALYHLDRAGAAPPSARPLVERLAAAVRAAYPEGVGSDAGFPVADSDNTAMALNVLHRWGYDDATFADALLAFESDGYFRGFAHERGAAVTANARVLEVFARAPRRFTPQIAKVTGYLLDVRTDEGWWHDKWHVSPYYATSQVVFGLGSVAPDELANTCKWLLDSQNSDGSWGVRGGQPEETGYAVLALDALTPHHGPVPEPVFARAGCYLDRHLSHRDYAELWLGKGLYTPTLVVEAVVRAAHTVCLAKAGGLGRLRRS